MSSVTSDPDMDEVKVFRSEPRDDDDMLDDNEMLDNGHSSQQLKEDKKEVACEIDLEAAVANNPCNQNVIFNPNNLKNNFLCQSAMYPALLNAAMMSSPHYAAANFLNTQRLLSPHFASLSLCSPQYSHSPSAFMPPQMLANYRGPLFPSTILNMSFPNVNLPNIQFDPPTPSSNHTSNQTPKRERIPREKRDKDHIKKPCNAFMLFMKENRSKFSNEYKVKQSSELNKEMGKAWHDLPKLEQDKYFEKAKQAKEEHTKLYPNWSARENYAINKKKRKKRERSIDPNNENNESKKCRARFGIERQDAWCKSCRRKKRCENAPLLP